MCHVPFTVLRFHKRTVAAFLDGAQIVLIRSQQRVVRHCLIGAEHVVRPRNRDTMGVPSTTFGHNQIVPAANVIDAGTFGAADAGAAVYLAAFAQQGAGFGVHLLHQHAFEAVDHIDQVALTVGIMQQRRVESDAVQVHRLAPRPCDGSGTAHIVMGVVPTALFGGHVGDKQVVILPIPAQVRGPDTAGVGVPPQVHLAGFAQRAWQLLPVGQVFGMVQVDTGPPFKGGCGNVIIVPGADHAGVRAKAAQDGVLDGFHTNISLSGRWCQCPEPDSG